jgi:O-antigen ligase
MIGLVAGWVVYMALTRQLVKKAYFIALLGTIFAIIVMPRIGHTHVFERGVLRQGTFSARTTYWQQAWPIVGDSATHFIFGHGIDSLLPGGALLPTATPQPDIAIDPELYTHGPHNQYLRTLLETGVIGLAALLLWIVGAIGAGARVAIRQGDPFAASLVSALVAMALVATAGDAFRDQATLAITALLSGLVAARAVALKANGVQPLGTSAQVEPKVAG